MNNLINQEVELALLLVKSNEVKGIPLEVQIAAFRIAAEACTQEILRQNLVAHVANNLRKP